MYVDAELTPMRNVAVTSAAVVSPDTIDLVKNRNIARDWMHMRIYAWVSTGFTTGGTSLTMDFIQSSNADLSTPDVLATSGAVVVADLLLGKVLLDVKVPNITKRYIGFRATNSGTLVAGRVTARLLDTTDSGNSYDAITGR